MVLAEMEAVTNRKIIDTCPDTYHNEFVALAEMFRAVPVESQSGRAVQIPFQYRETNQGGWYNGSHTAITPAAYETIAGGYLDWSYLFIDEYMDHSELVQNSGKEAFVKLMQRRGEDIVKKCKRLQCTETYTGTLSANEITGFAYWLQSGGTIANIDTAVYTTFDSNLKTQTGGISAMTKDDVNDLLADIYTDSGQPKCAFADWDIWQQLQHLTESQVRYADEEARSINAPSFKFGDCTFYFDSHATANKIYFIDPTTWRWIVTGSKGTYGIKTDAWEKRPDYVRTYQKVAVWSGQLICIDPRRNGAYTITA